ncbi:MAG: CDP-diacylglycerol--serine O-phosphatidyltransferase [Flavobacteriales bacterium]|jgi:CDP-diacylglycerol--serine O-phosphatidyltransferase|nr:CDP-diacylglycerol--serine O-phosphatidyltransferase [Flavobacteriales bacterium]MBT6013282.1 CDP-diacylglycerol--serine O-phosphatidyltransferase [Flavobacteriales bacterium]MBT7480807.1 CDP-diacylglycerol--serine O-phosphatidyltransferase [Flavobacteriales bacterium]
MERIKKNIPNLITLGNLTCGLLSIVLGLEGNLALAGAFIFYGAILDFFDGLVARLLKVSSEIGKQLDSMADMVTFGVVPGILMYQLISMTNENQLGISYELTIALIAFLIPIFSAIRLAKFNVDSSQTSSFIGLPTPAAAIFIASLPIIEANYGVKLSTELLIGTTVILSLLLVAEIPLFSLKISKGENLKSQLNIIRILFLISCVILLLVFHFVAIPFIVILYIFLSIINNLIK